MLTKAFGTDAGGVGVTLAAGSLAGLVFVVGLFLSYAVGAGYLMYVPTPWNLVAALAILVGTLALSVTVTSRGLRYHS